MECSFFHSVSLFISLAPPLSLISTISPAMSRLPVSLLSLQQSEHCWKHKAGKEWAGVGSETPLDG